MKKRMFSNAQLRRLIFPLLIEQLLAMLVGMVDTVMVSSAGETAISGVSIVNDLNNLVIALLSALAGGGAVIVSQYLGHGDRELTRKAASQLVMIAFVISTVLGLFCVAFHTGILQVLYGSVEADVMTSAKEYFWITALSFSFLGVYNSAAALFRSMNETRSTMNVSILMNVINVIGNYIGVYVLHLGAAGVAWPTLISRIVAAVVMVGMAFNPRRAISIAWNDILAWNRELIRKILSIAVPNGIENGLFQLGKVIVSIFVATYGTSQIAANGVSNSLSTLCYVSEMAIQLASVTVIGQCVGANDYEQAEYYVHKLIRIAWIMAAVNNLLVYLAMPYALSLYSLSSETLKIAETILTMECIAVTTIHAPAFVLPTCIRAAGDAKYTMYVGVGSMFGARVLSAYLLGTVLGMGVVGTRIGMYIDWGVRIIFFVYRWRSGKWKLYRLVSD
ncbi:MAG: MATE family efflux transporter [Galactobacillus timonensis]|uniref:MATE family efflux transporter n=1 Tax=Galactobacillus timonensis TaxID=2041840 RepID=UPI0023F191CA|nr:MATE family efflux transporter [Galactobacillus timonensis]MCI6067065.1 MATE family efflux transporter [Galactobacillus timonensis]MCI6755052.1 MATE family efflux transporter [Galactobacillus timonensis]MDD7086265.1 MATE family efflux transporter [Galactobacillus timonensis]MDY5221930.1 MATE family efflux transporter [Lachnospiraceae bacterium]